jgi:hypothetical protein
MLDRFSKWEKRNPRTDSPHAKAAELIIRRVRSIQPSPPSSFVMNTKADLFSNYGHSHSVQPGS